MRLRIPPFLPPYAVLFLVIAYAIAALWFGLARIDAIARLTQSTARNAATTHDLEALLNAVNDIETAGRGFALTADETYLEPFERGRRNVPILLSSLRDQMRDDASELALIETMVPLIAERTTISASAIERKRNAPTQPYEMAFGRRGKETSDGIRSVIKTLEAREQDQLVQTRLTQARTMSEARRDLYVMAGVTLLLVVSLFAAVRRLRSFIPDIRRARSEARGELAPDSSPWEPDAGLTTLLQDALLRTRLAAEAAPADSSEREQLASLIAVTEKAEEAHRRIASERKQSPREEQTVVEAMSQLAATYSRPDRLTVKATIDQSLTIADAQKAFLIFRAAEWALEVIMLRKRAGDVTLQFTANGDNAALHVHALTDNPELQVTLTPKESEESNALRNAATAVKGSFALGDGPTGLSLTLTIPLSR